MSVELREIVGRLEAAGLTEPQLADARGAIRIDGITTDSREVDRGTLFCAVRGNAADGHRFLAAAATAGAGAALVEEEDPAISMVQIVVRDGRLAAAHAAARFYGDPWDDVQLIGVTGTNGKTTTAAILWHLLSGRSPAASIGTLGIVGPDGKVVPGTEALTTPGPVQFAKEMRRLVDQGMGSVAMEVSSHALHQDRVAAGRFAAAIFTNLSRDHLDYHETVDAYRDAKLRLVNLVRPGGVVAINADDEAWASVAREGVHIVSFGSEGRGVVQAEGVKFGEDGVEWRLHTPSCTATVGLPLFGTYNVSNALAASAALWGLGWTADEIAERLASLPQVPGRLERVPNTAGAAILIDYAHTPDALRGALNALRPLVRGRLIVVFGAGGDRDRGKRPEMGRIAAESADIAIVTTDNPRHEDPDTIVDEIEAGMGDMERVRIIDRGEAIAHALEIGGEGDVILLAGKGHETYQIWGDERRPFDERAIIAELISQSGRHA